MAAAAAFLIARQQVVNCFAQVPQCDPSPLANFFAEPALSGVTDVVNKSNEQGLVLRNVDSYTTFIRSAALIDEQHVTLTYCGEDGIIPVRPTATGDVVLNDLFVSGTAEAMMVLDADGEWRVAQFNLLQEQASAKEESLCAAG